MTSTISLRRQRIKQDGAILLARRAMGEKAPLPQDAYPAARTRTELGVPDDYTEPFVSVSRTLRRFRTHRVAP
ncbi:hypothetical protein [Methylococcus mesophilus]|uniref:hypothetical protein n=1 Tax=Methylococcus mesophilus TaxID=2993564 RepID=UPI00224AADD0|nr:hypothetical protein [Methylococcus mesophilus]UZR29040.1 hypothetical protein OOT43_20420 [Methylococcus mesophilus]